jgi:enoyl-CoA hydratase/carnithine racemase
MALGQKLVTNAPLSLRHFKELAYRSLDMSESATAALTMRIYDQLLRSADAKEGPQAFAEKRQPRWQGR